MMFPPEELAADLPAPRDDEPLSLRADIVDELADHLHCAFRRELLLGPGSASEAERTASAQRRAVEKFGNPRALARSLWFDALWSQLMSQRLLVALMIVMTLVSGASLALTWQSLSASRDLAAQAQATNAALLKQLQSQPAPADLLKELRSLADNRPAPPAIIGQPSEWSHLRVKCTYDKPDGPPAPGVEVTCSLPNVGTGKRLPERTVTTDADGVADMGLVLYGTYQIHLKLGSDLNRQQNIAVYPGEDQTASVVCPSKPPTGTLQFAMKFPDGVSIPRAIEEKVWFLASLSSWSSPEKEWRATQKQRWILIAPSRKIALGSIDDPDWVWEHYIDGQGINQSPRPVGSLFGRVASSRLTLSPDVQLRERCQLPAGDYAINTFNILIEDSDRSLFVFDNNVQVPMYDYRNHNGSNAQTPVRFGNLSQQITKFRVDLGGDRPWIFKHSRVEWQLKFVQTLFDGFLPLAVLSDRCKPGDVADLIVGRDETRESVLTGIRTWLMDDETQRGLVRFGFFIIWLKPDELELIDKATVTMSIQTTCRPPEPPDEPRGTVSPKFQELIDTAKAKAN